MGKLKLSFSRLTRRFKSKDIENINENVSVSTRKVQLNVLPTVPRPFTYKPISTYFDKNKPFSFGKFRFDKECDFMIIGAGLMGSLMAYRLLENNINPDYKIIIVDKDLKLKNSSSAASLGLIRQRFKNEIYNKMANESFDFMYNFTTNDVNNRLTSRDTLRFHPEDHLILFDYSNKNDLDKIQNSDAMNITLSPKSIDNNYPFLNVKDLLAGNIGFENEGWIDPQYLISELHRHNDTKEVVHLQGEVVGFETETDQSNQANERIKFTNIKLEDGNVYSIMSSHIINCSGAASRSIVDITNDASINKIFNLDYPVTARRTYYYVLKCIDEGYDMEKNWLKMPVIYDPSGFTLRKHDIVGAYICSMDGEINVNADCDYNFENENIFFEKIVLSIIKKRFKIFDKIKIMHSWSKLHGHNYQDEGLIVGQHPIFLSMIFNNSGNQLLDFSLGPSMAHYLADQFRSIKKTTFIKEINNFKYHRFLKPKETLNLDTSENELMKSVNEK